MQPYHGMCCEGQGDETSPGGRALPARLEGIRERDKDSSTGQEQEHDRAAFVPTTTRVHLENTNYSSKKKAKRKLIISLISLQKERLLLFCDFRPPRRASWSMMKSPMAMPVTQMWRLRRLCSQNGRPRGTSGRPRTVPATWAPL